LIGGGGNAMAGIGGWSAVTLSVASALVALPEAFDTLQRN